MLLATEGGLEKYQGLDLNNINIDLNPISENRDLDDIITEQIPHVSANNSNIDLKSGNHQTKVKCSIKQKWSIKEKRVIAKYFADNIEKKVAPKQTEVMNFLEKYSELFEHRKWTSIKAVVYNFYTGKLIIPTDLV